VIAIDTNILVYADSASDPLGRHIRAFTLLESLSLTNNCVPLQVLAEFLNVSRRKAVMPFERAIARVQDYALLFDTPVTTLSDVADAGQLSIRHKLQFFDAVIVAVAIRAGATLLLSEDMHDGLVIDGLTIVNPFAPANESVLADWLGSAA
jgi:predicted nucleic acid-binding protein